MAIVQVVGGPDAGWVDVVVDSDFVGRGRVCVRIEGDGRIEVREHPGTGKHASEVVRAEVTPDVVAMIHPDI